MFRLRLGLFGIVVAASACASAATAASTAPCAQGDLTDIVASAAEQLPSACQPATGSVVVQTLYFQNASRVGGTALAAYPLVKLVGGVGGGFDVQLDAPSEIAQSGLRGAGSYPRTDPGIGLAYAIADTARFAASVGAEDRPPESPFAPHLSQPSYGLDAASRYTFGALSLDGTLTDLGQTPIRRLQTLRNAPAATFGVGYDAPAAADVTIDLGSRFVARHPRGQHYGDVSLVRPIGKNAAFDTGLGTTFAPVSNAKAHYLSAGLDFRR